MIKRGSEAPEWLTPEIDEALAAISEPHAVKKQTTVLLVAQAMATGESLRSVFERPDTCKADHWYGTTRRNGKRKLGWKEDPAIAAALQLATERARWWVRVKGGSAVQNALDALVDLSEDAVRQIAHAIRFGQLTFDRGPDIVIKQASVAEVLKASTEVLDRVSTLTATKTTTVQTMDADQFAALSAQAKAKATTVNEAAAQAWNPEQKPDDADPPTPS
ncbi:MAG: hypothetical protein E6Q97_14280 [Desulfurellales bacterium]|nr:MAG: hypothetical protein E6Q97_14280 [Desulfurellales bacterium]